MPNGDDMMDAMKFEGLIKDFTVSEQFLARQLREVKIECENRKICPVGFQFTKKQVAIGASSMGGIAVFVNLVVKLIETIGTLH